MKRNCIICNDEFDDLSKEKIKLGGKITECPDCAEETAVRYAGVQSADGKTAQATILKFSSDKDREAYIDFWKNNSGFNKGKSCQLGGHLKTTPNIQFETVVDFTPTNHKGKAQ